MKEERVWYKGADKLNIHVFKWLPEGDVKGVLLLVHGSVEHAARYRHFAEFLTKNNIAVIAPDLRGHGQTALKNGQMSFIAKENGWNLIIEDLVILKKTILREFSDVPLFIFGHSMGSFIVRDFISRHAEYLKGAIVCGSTIGKPLLAKIMLPVMKIMLWFRKSNAESPFLHKAIYGMLNSGVKNPRTEVDFISRDAKEVDKYIADPLSGCTVTIDYALQLTKGSLLTSTQKSIRSIPDELPIMVVSGSNDPVGGKNGMQVKQMVKAMEKGGKKNIDFKLYPDARHELINEINKDEIMNDILSWITKH